MTSESGFVKDAFEEYDSALALGPSLAETLFLGMRRNRRDVPA
jgi:hypothetical protein